MCQPDDMDMINVDAEPAKLWPFSFGGAAGLVLGVLFLVGAIAILTAATNAAGASARLSPLQDNWLVTLFKVNLPGSTVTSAALTGLNPLDISIMVLFATFSFSIYLALRQTSRVWSIVAMSLPIFGIPVFIATGTAGRSALLVSALIISIVMLRSDNFSRLGACIGVAASALLFFGGDIATALFHSADVIAGIIAIGYVLWVTWLVLVAVRLLQLGRIRQTEA